ncbi:MAG: hypothetical protein RL204_2432 [Bacteroidota bacterium]|jgi:hypothetical protein
MNLKYIFATIALFVSIVAQGQINVEVLKDDPEDMQVYRARIPLWTIQPASSNFSVYAANFGFEAQFKKVYLSTTYNILLGDKLMPETQDGSEYPASAFVASQFEDQWSRYFHIEGTYFFKQNLEQTELDVHVRSSGNVKYYTMVPAKILKSTGLRLGYRQGFQWYHLHGGDFKSDVDFFTEDQSTYLNYSQLRIGIGRAKMTNLLVNVKDYGKRSNSGTVFFYADMILALSQELEDVYYFHRSTGGFNSDPNAVYYTAHEIDQYNEKQKLGFEVGVRFLPSVGRIGYQAQFGSVTGIKGVFSTYLELGATISLGSKEKA